MNKQNVALTGDAVNNEIGLDDAEAQLFWRRDTFPSINQEAVTSAACFDDFVLFLCVPDMYDCVSLPTGCLSHSCQHNRVAVSPESHTVRHITFI